MSSEQIAGIHQAKKPSAWKRIYTVFLLGRRVNTNMTERLRIATWNLDHASNGRRPVALQVEKILSIKPDILVLTETCKEVDLFAHGYSCIRCLPNEYTKYYSSIHLGPRVKVGQAIPTFDGVTAVCARVETPIGAMTVYGTIITWHGDKGPSKDAPAWSEHYKAITDHNICPITTASTSISGDSTRLFSWCRTATACARRSARSGRSRD